jgi:hypothetical protein
MRSWLLVHPGRHARMQGLARVQRRATRSDRLQHTFDLCSSREERRRGRSASLRAVRNA